MKPNYNLAYYQTYHKPLNEYEPRELWNEIDKRRDKINRAGSFEEENHAQGLKMYSDSELVDYLGAIQQSVYNSSPTQGTGKGENEKS